MKASSSVATTMIGVSAFGRTWRSSRRHDRLPRARAPLTNSRSRIDSTSARTIRANCTQRVTRHHQDHVDQARPQREDDAHREQDVRDGEEHVHHAHDEGIGAAPVEAGEEAEGDADQAGERHRREADAERDPAAVEDAAQDVAPEVIGAERMLAQTPRLPHGGPEPLDQHLPGRIPRRDLRRQERRPAHDEEHREPEDGAEAQAAARRGAGAETATARPARGLVHRALRTKTMRGSRYV